MSVRDPRFTDGVVVQLRSGGWGMVIEHVEPEDKDTRYPYYCVWHDRDGHPHSHYYSAAVLELA